ncbi:MAG: hypothetical protein ACLFRW_00335 [Halorhodospira sp.]
MHVSGPRVGWLVGLLATPALAIAAGTASVQTEDQTLEVLWQDESKARITPQGQSDYIVMRDDKLYGVSTGGSRTMVVDLTAMAGMMGQMGLDPSSTSPGPNQAMDVESFGATGETETVAGLQGEVYEVRWREQGGRTHTDQAVLSDNPLVVELMTVMAGATQALAEAMDREHGGAVEERLSARGLGILRYNETRVTEISDEAPGEGAFELPAEPMNSPGMGGIPGGQ